jgi:DNA-binding transcriptional MerR regulator
MVEVPPESSWSLGDLVTEVGRLLGALGLDPAAADGRVNAVPDIRTVRYYTSLGLLDRPRIQGRDGRYGRRHLLQLAAIKALQADGLSLGDIQARLHARTDGELTTLLEAVARREANRPVPVPAAVTWREVVLEPGLRLLAASDWSPASRSTLIRTFEAAIAALSTDGAAAGDD